MNYSELIEKGTAWNGFLGVTENIDSSMIKSVGTEGIDLFVQFQNDTWYMAEFGGIEYQNMLDADSIGKFWHSTIKKNYSIYKIEDDGEAKLVQ